MFARVPTCVCAFLRRCCCPWLIEKCLRSQQDGLSWSSWKGPAPPPSSRCFYLFRSYCAVGRNKQKTNDAREQRHSPCGTFSPRIRAPTFTWIRDSLPFAHVLYPLQLFFSFSSSLFYGLGVGGNSVCRGSRRLREDALSLSQTIEFSRTSETCPFTSVYVTVLLQYTCRWL